ncbi:MAG TPA: thioredoxin family protein [Microbacterium sp.]|uniref:thioredoxin family protein n=1 Tax=Microbacterium sp. TaxID=51671 RepID=UPI002B4714F9|nr:thioredoxin family protein [Microbacterium sp.]HKT56473.1 thioredoxin family protein [Microbacterium sp.]
MEITLQYFDGCPNWKILDGRLAEVLAGYADASVSYQRVRSADDATRLGFRGSPTVLIDGVDPFAEPDAPVGLACRVFRTPAGPAGAPTVDQLRAAIFRV